MLEVSIAVNVSENTMPGALVSVANSETVSAVVSAGDWEGLFLQVERQLERLVADVHNRAAEQIQEHRQLASRNRHPFQKE